MEIASGLRKTVTALPNSPCVFADPGFPLNCTDGDANVDI